MLGVLSAAPADKAQYERSSSNVYDAARVVTPKEFDTPRLLTLFREFAVAHCGRQKLARLTLAANRKDLINATNVNLPEGNLKGIPGLLRAEPSLLGTSIGQPVVAQLLCFGDEATAIVRRSSDVERYQISGDRDSFKLGAGRTGSTVVGFRLYVAPRNNATGPTPLPDIVHVYVKAEALPALEVAGAARRDLESRIGVMTFLTVRTDPFFFDRDGPRSDVFEIPSPKISIADFLTRPFVDCWPGNGPGDKEGCGLKRSHIGEYGGR